MKYTVHGENWGRDAEADSPEGAAIEVLKDYKNFDKESLISDFLIVSQKSNSNVFFVKTKEALAGLGFPELAEIFE